jgi:glycosyltransferase involved in cell wall biosynthesis
MARVCVIRQWNFPNDPRVGREVDALTRAGHEVDVICVKFPNQARFERTGRVTAYRIPIARRRGGGLRYIFEFATFMIAASLLVTALHLRRRYAIVQVNSIPDSLVFAALIPKLLGARVVLDLHECMPEFFGTKYGLARDHRLVRALVKVEAASIAFADAVTTCTDPMRDRFIERGAPRDKVRVILNTADEDVYDSRRFAGRGDPGDRFVLVYHGTIEERFGVDTVVRAVALLKDEIPGLHLKMFGDGVFRRTIESLVTELGVEDRVWLSRGWVPLEDLLAAIASADAGVVPTKRDWYRDLTLANKMFDFVAMRKPAIVGRTPAVEAYFDDSCFQMFESGNAHDLARAIRELYADPALGHRLVRRASAISEPYRWVYQAKRYVDIVDHLIVGGPARGGQTAVPREAIENR